MSGREAAAEARDLPRDRGPFHGQSPHTSRERIRTVVVGDHAEMARMVAGRIAALVRANASRRSPSLDPEDPTSGFYEAATK